MKIVVLDGYTLNPGDLSWASLEAMGETVIYDRTSLTDHREIIQRIGDADAVLGAFIGDVLFALAGAF